MTNSVIPFSFNSNEVRTIVKDDAVWFVASDIAKALNFRDAEKMTRMLDDDEKDTHIVGSRSENGVEQNREVTIINESGLYHALIKSRKPEAKPFRKWVTGEVLPTIRKTGSYTAPERKTKQVLIGKLTADQQDAIKALVNSRIDSVHKEKQRGTAMKLWGAINRKFGTKTYKDIDQSEFVNVLSLVSRLPLEGELMPRNETPTIPEGMVLVRKDLLEETNNMIRMIDERFSLLELAEKEMTYFHDLMQILANGAMVKANNAIREARYRLIDPIKHAKSYTGLMLN